MPDKSSEVDKAFADDLGEVDFKARFDDPPAQPDDARADDTNKDGAENDAEGSTERPPTQGSGESSGDRSSGASESSQPHAGEPGSRNASASSSRTVSSNTTPRSTPSPPKERSEDKARPAPDTAAAAASDQAVDRHVQADDLDPNQTVNQDGYIRERPTHYLRPDQMKALRVSKAMRDSPFGRTMTEIASALFDLFGFNDERDRHSHDNYGYPDDAVLDRLIPEDQWDALLERAREEEGQRASRKALMYRVSRLIEDALGEEGYGDGRKRRRT
jgi:hypothetical protein